METWSNQAACGPHAAPEAAGAQAVLRAWLRDLEPGPAHAAGSLALTPLLRGDDGGEPLVLLHEALASGQLEIGEMAGGTVNEVVAHNAGPGSVLVLEGETIVGAKQNRAVSRDVLIGAGQAVGIPVGCVERGRWDTRHAGFGVSASPVDPEIRARTVAEVSQTGRVDQARLWAHVNAKLAKARVASRTSDYHAFVSSKRKDADALAAAVPSHPGQVGVLALAGGGLVGFDVFAHPANWAAISSRLLRSYLLVAPELSSPAIAAPGAADPGAPRDAKGWLSAISYACVRTSPTPGLGIAIGIEGDGVMGAGLLHAERVAHLSAFGVAPAQKPVRAPRWQPVGC